MRKLARVLVGVSLLLLLAAVPRMHAAEGEDLDAYKWRVGGVWWFSHPSGFFQGANKSGEFDLDRDLGFGNYSTFTGKVDWRFKRKHHLLFLVAPVTFSRDTTLTRTIEFQGQTFEIGTTVSTRIRSLSFAPGYQYDIIRRNHGYLGVMVNCRFLQTSADLSATVTVSGQTQTEKASGSIFAPLPTVGPTFRWYPLRDSNRLSLDGTVTGMYFFGYGDFLSAQGAGNIALSRHWTLRLGYQMGTRLSVHGTSDQIGVRLTQKGPVAGVEASW